MFGKLKEKLKSALSIFTKKAEEELEVKPIEEAKSEVEIKEVKESPKEEISKEKNLLKEVSKKEQTLKSEETKKETPKKEITSEKHLPKPREKEIITASETKETKTTSIKQKSFLLSREQALELVLKYNSDQSDLNHYLESEAVMQALARKLGEDEEYWGMLGLLHDIDWGLTKSDTSKHLTKAPELLKKAGFGDDFINIILSHGYGFDCAGLKEKKRTQMIEHALAASETVTGLVHAYALMRGGLEGMEAKGLKKKFKDKAFAAGVRREIIQECELIGVSLDEFLELSIKAIFGIKDKLHWEKKLEEKVAEKKTEPEHYGEKREEKPSEIKVAEKKDKIHSDTIKITYFVHGTTTDNEKDISSGSYDVELSELGVKQSIELKKQIKINDFDVVFCSDLKRAVHSAELTFKDKVKIIQDKRLRECDYGEYNAKPSKIVEPLQEQHITKRFPDGESYEDVKKRIADFLIFLQTNYAGKHIAIVAHKVPQLALDVLLKNKTWKHAFAEDWRKRKAWQPGWEYYLTINTILTVEKPKESESQPEEKRGFFSKLFGKKEEPIKEQPQDTFTEISVPETFNPATQKYEPNLAKIKDISIEKEEIKAEEIKAEEAPIPEKKSFLDKLKQTLTTKTISAEKFEELFWELEVALLENNVSVEVIEKIKEDLKEELVEKPLPRDVEKVILDTLHHTLQEILSTEKINLLERIKIARAAEKKPYIIAFFGINGSGKTTSIAKLTYYLQQQGLSIVLAACDTFRAAAIQQLEEHANRLNVKMIQHEYGSDAAAVAFDAVKYAEKNSMDVVLIDTAGRLHSNTNLMAELEKILRVTKPDLKLFVGESITGNDCIEQARTFNQLVEMDGVILTKADVDEKGGAPLSIAYTIKKPILFLGMGQEYKDLEEFNAEKIMGRLGL